jgi:hypothetical protein
MLGRVLLAPILSAALIAAVSPALARWEFSGAADRPAPGGDAGGLRKPLKAASHSI